MKIVRAIPALLAAAVAVVLVTPRLVRSSDRRRSDSAGALPDSVAGLADRRVTSRDGTQLAVVEKGEGRPIVLVHGLGVSHAVWYGQFDELAAGHRVVAVDLRGHGDSDEGVEGYGPTLYAEDVVAVLEGLDLQDAVLVGHSLGGTAVSQFAVDHPDVLAARVGGLVLVGTFASAIKGEGWWRERFGPPSIKLMGRLQGATGSRTESPTGAMAYLTARGAFGADPQADHVERLLELGSRTPPSVWAACTIANLDYDVRDQLGAVTTPALVVAGERDRLAPLRSASRLEECLGRAELVVLEDTGHMMMFERSDEISTLIARFADDADLT